MPDMTTSTARPSLDDWQSIAAALPSDTSASPGSQQTHLQQVFDAFLATLGKPGSDEAHVALERLINAATLAAAAVEYGPAAEQPLPDKRDEEDKEPTEAERLGEEFARGFRRGLARHMPESGHGHMPERGHWHHRGRMPPPPPPFWHTWGPPHPFAGPHDGPARLHHPYRDEPRGRRHHHHHHHHPHRRSREPDTSEDEMYMSRPRRYWH